MTSSPRRRETHLPHNRASTATVIEPASLHVNLLTDCQSKVRRSARILCPVHVHRQAARNCRYLRAVHGVTNEIFCATRRDSTMHHIIKSAVHLQYHSPPAPPPATPPPPLVPPESPFQSLHQMKVPQRHSVPFSFAPLGPSGRAHIQKLRP